MSALIVSLDCVRLEEELKMKNYASVTQCLKNKFKVKKDWEGVPYKVQMETNELDFLSNLLQTLTAIKQRQSDEETLLVELLKVLSFLVINEVNAEYFSNVSHFFTSIKSIIDAFNPANIDTLPDIERHSFNLLCNIVVANNEVADTIYELLGKTILSLLENKACLVKAAALLYNLCLHSRKGILNSDIFTRVLDLYMTEFELCLFFILVLFMKKDSCWECFDQFELEHRLTILELLEVDCREDKKIVLPESALKVLARKCSECLPLIYKLNEVCESNQPVAAELGFILLVIGNLTAEEKYLIHLQEKDLLINIGTVLLYVHKVGKEGKNCFTPVQKLGASSSVLKDTEVDGKNSLAYGFKAKLIRIIGNLCWKNKTMQDLVRELDLIPILLDCCTIDANNPYCMEWVIWTIRNLCWHNPENQAVIDSFQGERMTKTEVMDKIKAQVSEMEQER